MPHERESYSKVRLLAAEYAQGYIDRDTYRQRRAELIGRLVAGEEPLEYVKQERPSPREGDDAMEIGGSDFDAQRMPPVLPVAIGVAVLLVALIAGTWWLLATPASVPEQASDTGTAVQAELPEGEAQLNAFLERNDWSIETIDTLIRDWQALEPDVRSETRGTAAWRRFQSALRSRINEQQVLADYDETGEAALLEERMRALQELLNQD